MIIAESEKMPVRRAGDLNLKGAARKRIIESIQTGKFRVAELLPPVANLSRTLKCSEGTVRQALHSLARDGVVKSTKHSGCRVLRVPPAGRICFVPSSDGHINVIFQNPIFNRLLEAGYDIDFLPLHLDARYAGQQWQRLMQSGAPFDFIVVLDPEHLKPAAVSDLKRMIEKVQACITCSVDGPVALGEKAVVIMPDYPEAVQLVLKHLLSLGHRKILVDGGAYPDEQSVPGKLSRICESLLAMAGAECVIRYNRDDDEALLRLFKHEGVTAYWAALDVLAINAMILLRGAGIKVPQDVTLVGRFDTPYSWRQLSSISLDPEGVADTVLQVISALQDGREVTPSIREVKTKLIVRQSSGPAPNFTPLPPPTTTLSQPSV